MSAMDKLHSSIGHCQYIEMALKNKKVASRLSKIPNGEKRVAEILKLISEAMEMLDDLRHDYHKKADEGE